MKNFPLTSNLYLLSSHLKPFPLVPKYRIDLPPVYKLHNVTSALKSRASDFQLVSNDFFKIIFQKCWILRTTFSWEQTPCRYKPSLLQGGACFTAWENVPKVKCKKEEKPLSYTQFDLLESKESTSFQPLHLNLLK